jgi:predicted secreted Zn-dependent protease
MLPSTSRRRPAGLRRALISALVTLLVPIALLVAVASAPHAAPSVHDRVQSALASSTAAPADGGGAGGSLVSRENGLALSTDPFQVPDGQATAMAPAIQLTSSTHLYDVEGTDVPALLASLRQRGPADDSGTWAASTGWVFRWSYQPIIDVTCQVQTASVTLDLTYTYPHWTPAPATSNTLVSAWEGYLSHVELHEHGHRDIAQATATDLLQALEALPAQTTCDDLANAARATADAILTRHAQAQIAYDRDTRHGATQGAVLTLSR